MYNNQDSKFGWVKWSLLAIAIFALICLIFAIFLYKDIQKDENSAYAETEAQLLGATSLTEVSKIEQFNGSEAYHVVFGKNEDNEEKIIFYPLAGREKNLTTIDRNEIIPEEEIQSQWSEQCNGCELIEIVPALDDGNELWEITYYDEANNYVFAYVSIYDGAQHKQYRLNSMFN
ncbi:cell wall elongation regulator TseB-like domain-containing protein [Virgibacillus ainsalahensis]